MAKVLVTGATSGLGRNLAEKLHSMGHRVVCLGRNDAIGNELINRGMRYVKCDLAHDKDLDDVFQGQEYVFHAAAKSSLWGNYRSFLSNNLFATENVITHAKKHNIKRLIHISTPSIYFDFQDKTAIKESDPLPAKFVNYYAHTKYLAEEKVDQAFREGLETITIRPRAIFGKYDNVLMPRIIRIAKKGVFPVMNSGMNIIDITHVDNVVHALILSMHADNNALGQKFNITNNEPMEFRQILLQLMSAFNIKCRLKNVNYKLLFNFANILENFYRVLHIDKEPILTKYSVGVLAKSQTLDITKAKELLKYNPITSIEKGIIEYAEQFKR